MARPRPGDAGRHRFMVGGDARTENTVAAAHCSHCTALRKAPAISTTRTRFMSSTAQDGACLLRFASWRDAYLQVEFSEESAEVSCRILEECGCR